MKNDNYRDNFYTVGEIISKLRPLYIDMQKNLNELMQYIRIDTKDKYNANLKLEMKYEKNMFFDNPMAFLLLTVERNPNNIDTIIRDRIYLNGGNLENLYRNNATYHITFENDKIDIKKENKYDSEKAFNPKIYVNNNEAIKKVIDKIKENELYKISRTGISLNLFQSLCIAPSYINLLSVDDKDNSISIGYQGNKDTIEVTANYNYSPFIIDELIDTKVPKYELPNEYIEILDNSHEAEDIIFPKLKKKEEKLAIDQIDKKLILTRKNR